MDYGLSILVKKLGRRTDAGEHAIMFATPRRMSEVDLPEWPSKFNLPLECPKCGDTLYVEYFDKNIEIRSCNNCGSQIQEGRFTMPIRYGECGGDIGGNCHHKGGRYE